MGLIEGQVVDKGNRHSTTVWARAGVFEKSPPKAISVLFFYLYYGWRSISQKQAHNDNYEIQSRIKIEPCGLGIENIFITNVAFVHYSKFRKCRKEEKIALIAP